MPALRAFRAESCYVFDMENRTYIPSRCNGCPNHCPLARPSCVIGMQRREEVGYRDEPEKPEENKKQR